MRITIAEDSLLLREGLIRLVQELGHEVICAVEDAPALISSIRADLPDLAIVDVRMPPHEGDDGLLAALALRREFTELKVLILSQYIALFGARELLDDGRGGVGYLLKDRVQDLDQFDAALKEVARGGVVIDPEVVAQLVRRPSSLKALLSPREYDVLARIAVGNSNQAIADILHVSLGSVEKYISSIYMKLQLPEGRDSHRRVLAVLALLDDVNQ